MRNIYISDYSFLNISQQIQILKFDFDEFSQQIYILTSDFHILICHLNKLINYEILSKTDVSQEIMPELNILSFKYIVETESIVIIADNGDIFKYETQSFQIENMGMIENGILGCSWSPNQENLVIATKNFTLIQMDAQFDVKNEIQLNNDDSQKILDSLVNFSWKSDGKYFAYNLAVEGGRKCITREANLTIHQSLSKADGDMIKSVSEDPVKDLTEVIAYWPNGALITGVQDDKVIFWEKNGLRHGEFQLYEKMKINNLKWNCNSDVMCIFNSSKNEILLYHRSNYKWFLKKNISLHESFLDFLFVKDKLILVYQNASIEVIDVQLDYCFIEKTYNQISQDHNSLLITQLDFQVVPPPMCSFQIENDSTLFQFANRQNTIVTISESKIMFYIVNGLKNYQEFQIKNEFCSKYSRTRHLTIIQQDNIYFLIFVVNEKEKQFLVELKLSKDDEKVVLLDQKKNEINQNVLTLNESHIKNKVFIQTVSGQVLEYQIDQEDFQIDQFTKLKQPCIKFQAAYLQHSQKEIIITLSQNLRLYVDNRLISSECTSFQYQDEFLYFTSVSPSMYHLLYVFDLSSEDCLIFNSTSDNVSNLLPNHESKSLNVRNVERGTKLVNCIGEKLIFQMTRGNMELIYPRLVILKKVYQNCKCGDFKKSFELLRQHKMDMNLLFDIDPEYFETNGFQIFSNLENKDYINLFLNMIKREQSEYLQWVLTKKELSDKQDSFQSKFTQNKDWKIQTICNTAIDALTRIDQNKYIMSILTAYICKNDLEFVLNYVQQLRADEKKTNIEELNKVAPNFNPKNGVQKKSKAIDSSELLEFVCWMADPDNMYQVALLTYDLELVSLVAKQTQKDPKEYIPYLKSLQQLENQVEMKSRICLDLKKYSKAIVELSQGSLEQRKQALKLVQQEKLYTLGMKTFQGTELNEVKRMLAESLIEKSDFQQAATIFLSAKMLSQAQDAYLKNNDWKMVVKMSQLQKKSQEEILQLKHSLLEKFSSENKFNYLAEIYKDLGQNEKAYECYVKANSWKDLAIFENDLEDIQHLRQKYLQQSLKLCYDLRINLLKKQRQEYLKKVQRLKVVQTNKAAMPLLFQNNSIKDADLASEQSFQTATSFMTVTTIGGGRRKQKKPKNLKHRNMTEGSPMEEEWLVDVLMDMKITKSQLNEIESLVESLVYFDFIDEAKQLYDQTRQYVKDTSNTIKLLSQQEFEKQNSEAIQDMYSHIEDFKNQNKTDLEIQTIFNKFDYLFK